MCEHIKIIKSNGHEWYANCIGKIFRVHSESRKGGKDKYIVRLSGEDKKLMNGYPYGWINKSHCKEVIVN